MEKALGNAPARTVIIGSRGRMGAMLCARARRAGLDIAGLDQPLEGPRLAEACGNAELAIICVPAAAFGDVLEKICPHLRRDAVLCDIASVKEGPMRQMSAAWQGPVVGTHPLFGPGAKPDEDQPVAIVPGPGAGNAQLGMVRAFFESLGCRVFQADAGGHDRAMACIQNMNFITSLAYFALLARHEELLPYITPSFRRRMVSARKMLTEDAGMFSGLFEANAYSQEEVRRYRKMLALAASGDLDLLTNLAAWWWRDGAENLENPRLPAAARAAAPGRPRPLNGRRPKKSVKIAHERQYGKKHAPGPRTRP